LISFYITWSGNVVAPIPDTTRGAVAKNIYVRTLLVLRSHWDREVVDDAVIKTQWYYKRHLTFIFRYIKTRQGNSSLCYIYIHENHLGEAQFNIKLDSTVVTCITCMFNHLAEHFNQHLNV